LLRVGDFTEGFLPHDSYVRPEKLFTGNQSLVLSRAGHAGTAIHDTIYHRLIELFQPLHSTDADALE
jgi:vancomycin permeability regulator SanA